jgi:hypothetical protein
MASQYHLKERARKKKVWEAGGRKGRAPGEAQDMDTCLWPEHHTGNALGMQASTFTYVSLEHLFTLASLSVKWHTSLN